MNFMLSHRTMAVAELWFETAPIGNLAGTASGLSAPGDCQQRWSRYKTATLGSGCSVRFRDAKAFHGNLGNRSSHLLCANCQSNKDP